MHCRCSRARTLYAPGTISFPDTLQPKQPGVPASVPVGADIVAAYLYWSTVESSTSSFAGETGFFNGYPITGTILGNARVQRRVTLPPGR